MGDKRKQKDGGFGKFLYNSETGECLGRTGSSWAKILVFYIFFYTGLAAFFGLMLYIFYITLDMNQPKWQGTNGLIGDNPGVGFRPAPDEENVESTLIWYRKADGKDLDFWSNKLENFLKPYRQSTSVEGGSVDLKSCQFGGEKADDKRGCKVDVVDLKECNANNKFGYKMGEPCILIKLNKIYGWEPVGLGMKKGRFDNATLMEDLDEQKKNGMSNTLRNYLISKAEEYKNDNKKLKSFMNSVWIGCDGENPADREHIGPIEYYPIPGIAGYHFPYKKQPGYLPPFVMIQLKGVITGVLINIECKAFAKNIHPDRATRVGSVHFELLID